MPEIYKNLQSQMTRLDRVPILINVIEELVDELFKFSDH